MYPLFHENYVPITIPTVEERNVPKTSQDRQADAIAENPLTHLQKLQSYRYIKGPDIADSVTGLLMTPPLAGDDLTIHKCANEAIEQCQIPVINAQQCFEQQMDNWDPRKGYTRNHALVGSYAQITNNTKSHIYSDCAAQYRGNEVAMPGQRVSEKCYADKFGQCLEKSDANLFTQK